MHTLLHVMRQVCDVALPAPCCTVSTSVSTCLAWLGHTCTAVPHPAGSGLARLGVPEAAAQMAQAGSKGKGGNLGSEEGGKKSEGEKPAVQQPVRASTCERKPVQRADA